MPTFRVFIDEQAIAHYVTSSSYADAYFDVASTFPLTYHTSVRLEEIDPS